MPNVKTTERRINKGIKARLWKYDGFLPQDLREPRGSWRVERSVNVARRKRQAGNAAGTPSVLNNAEGSVCCSSPTYCKKRRWGGGVDVAGEIALYCLGAEWMGGGGGGSAKVPFSQSRQ